MRAVVFLLPILAACAVAEIPGTRGAVTSEEGSASRREEPATKEEQGLPAVEGGADLGTVDLDELEPCACEEGGKAHCVATSKLPASLSKELATCDGNQGACVPDTILESGGEPPPACMAAGQEGRCVSLCVPKVAQYAAVLQRGACADDERCVPCKMPDGSSSGICSM